MRQEPIAWSKCGPNPVSLDFKVPGGMVYSTAELDETGRLRLTVEWEPWEPAE